MNENYFLPDFFIVGAPKAGTTSLYYYLEQHPDIFMSPVKEPNYFSFTEIEKQNLYYTEKGISNWEDYVALFRNSSGKKARGEASVSYLFYPGVAKNIFNKIPEARIIIMLRNPIDRAFSHYEMDYRLGYVKSSFSEIVFDKNKNHLRQMQFQQYVLLGNYAEQVNRYFEVFGKKNVFVVLFDDFKTDAEGVIKKLYKFLQVNPDFENDTEEKHNISEQPRNKLLLALYRTKAIRKLMRKLFPASIIAGVKKILMTKKKSRNPEVVSFLRNYYMPGIIELENILNRNLKNWYE